MEATNPLLELLGDSILVIKNDQIENISYNDFRNQFKGEFVGFYFGAHWAPPSRLFTSNLKQFYQDTNAGESKVEIVFVSDDRREDHFKRNFQKMPWKAIPFTEEHRI